MSKSKSLFRLYEKRMISGVCAGLAGYFSIPAWVVRIVAILALCSMPVVTGVAYLLATILLPEVRAFSVRGER